MLWPKKNSYKEFDNEKKFLRLKNSPPPPPHKTHNFSNGPSLSRHTSSTTREHTHHAGVWENRKGFLTYNLKNDYERTLNKKELSISSLEIF